MATPKSIAITVTSQEWLPIQVQVKGVGGMNCGTLFVGMKNCHVAVIGKYFHAKSWWSAVAECWFNVLG